MIEAKASVEINSSPFKPEDTLRIPKPSKEERRSQVISKQFEIIDLNVEDVDHSPDVEERQKHNSHMMNFINVPLTMRDNQVSKFKNNAVFKTVDIESEDESQQEQQHKLLNVGRLTMELPESSADLNNQSDCDERTNSNENVVVKINSSTSSIETSVESHETLTKKLLGIVPPLR